MYPLTEIFHTNTSSRTACRPSSSVVLQLIDWLTSLASSGTLAFSCSKTSHSNSLYQQPINSLLHSTKDCLI